MVGIAQGLVGSFAAEQEPSFPLPANCALIWGDLSNSTPPAGFTFLSTNASLNEVLRGVSSAASSNSPTSFPGTFSPNPGGSPSAGSHGPPWTPSGNVNGGFTNPQTVYDLTTGSHQHTVSFSPTTLPSTILPPGLGIKLITNAAQVDNIPVGAVVFCASAKPGFTKKFWSPSPTSPTSYRVYIVRPNPATTGTQISATPFPVTFGGGPSGAHQHTRTQPASSGPGGTFTNQVRNNPSGAHQHPITSNSGTSGYVFQFFKHLLPWEPTTPSPVRSGMIVMFVGSTVPAGWNICNGSNGTPNMVEFFLGYDDNLTNNGTHDAIVGNRAVKFETTPPPRVGNTSTTYTPTPFTVTHNTVTWPHTHAAPPPLTVTTNTRSHFHGTLSVPHSHPGQVVNITVDVNYIPNSRRMLFIQKA